MERTRRPNFEMSHELLQKNWERVEDHVKNYRPKLIVMCGCPSDRPLLVDFANLITKRISFLELVHIVNEGIDLKTMQNMKDLACQWLHENHIKAFYAITRNSSFCSGVRTSIELSGLGKLSPNMMLIGFQEHWWLYPHFAEEYFRTLQLAFDMHLSVGVLRVNGGLDIADYSGAHQKIMETSRQCSDMSDMSTDSRMRRHSSHGGSGIVMRDLSASRNRSVADFGGKRSLHADLSFGIRDGNPIDERIIHRNTQFRDRTQKEGFIDVYWLYDDGGLTLLLPHILSTRSKFSKCKLRIFFLSNSNKNIEEEAKSMASLLVKFRIEFEDVVLLKDATRRPLRQTRSDETKSKNYHSIDYMKLKPSLLLRSICSLRQD